ncbi:NEU4 isoform 11, partial [Pan troglodytes]
MPPHPGPALVGVAWEQTPRMAAGPHSALELLIPVGASQSMGVPRTPSRTVLF